MKTKTIILLTLLAFGCIAALTGCTTSTGAALASIAKSNADSKAHVKIIANIPPNTITYERWIPGEATVAP